MKRWLAPFVLLLALLPSLTQAARQSDDYVVLCYHDIVESEIDPNLKLYPQTIRRDTLIRHFNWIKQQGYHPVSFQQNPGCQSGQGTAAGEGNPAQLR